MTAQPSSVAAPLRLRPAAAARNIGLVFGGQAALSASKAGALLVLSHHLAPARFAECAIYASSSLVVGNLCELGINISCLKFAAEAERPEWLRTVSRFLLLRLALTTGVIVAVFLLAPAASAKLLKHPEYSTALRLACGSAAIASLSAFSLVLLQSRREFARMARLSVAAAILQIVPVALLLRSPSRGIAILFAGDLLSRSWIVAANLGLLGAALMAARTPGPRPAWRSIAVFANWITLSTLVGALYNYIPSITLSRWANDSALGAYGLGMSLAGGFALLLNTTSTVLLPDAVAANTRARRQSYVRSYLPGAALMSATLLARRRETGARRAARRSRSARMPALKHKHVIYLLCPRSLDGSATNQHARTYRHYSRLALVLSRYGKHRSGAAGPAPDAPSLPKARLTRIRARLYQPAQSSAPAGQRLQASQRIAHNQVPEWRGWRFDNHRLCFQHDWVMRSDRANLRPVKGWPSPTRRSCLCVESSPPGTVCDPLYLADCLRHLQSTASIPAPPA